MTRDSESAPALLKWIPWALAAAALGLYIATLSTWVSSSTLSVAAKVFDWDWRYPVTQPITYLLAYPIRWLPAGMQFTAFNLLAALFAAASLGLLARSILLLPHDRTREQRQREHSAFALLSIPLAWVPPVLAVTAFALQLTFWEHATAFSGEMVDLFLFAYGIRALLEYRLDQRSAWIYKLALVYGLGVANNWAMAAYAPLFAIAAVWILGRRLLQFRFLLNIVLFGLLGLAAYLILPALYAAADPDMGFWSYLNKNLEYQRTLVLANPLGRARLMLLGLFSILPILLIGIRWPSNLGETSAAGSYLTNLMFYVVHLAYLGLCLWIMFDPPFSPRQVSMGLFPFLTIYYLAALAAGYFAGYALLVFGRTPPQGRRREGALTRALKWGIVGAIVLAVAGIPAGLAYRNAGVIRQSNAAGLKNLAEEMLREVPDKSILFSDHLMPVYFGRAATMHRPKDSRPLFIYSLDLGNPRYHRHLENTVPHWIRLEGASERKALALSSLQEHLKRLSSDRSLFYINPGLNQMLETFYAMPHGMVWKLTPYAPREVTPPPISAESLQAQRDYWQAQAAKVPALPTERERTPYDLRYVRETCSRNVNHFGVLAIQAGQPAVAMEAWNLALRFDSENESAWINREYHTLAAQNRAAEFKVEESIRSKLAQYRGNLRQLLETRGPVEEPELCFILGMYAGDLGFSRQSALQFLRHLHYQPQNTEAQYRLASLYVSGGALPEARKLLAQLKQGKSTAFQELQLLRLEARLLFAEDRKDEAERLLLKASQEQPQNQEILDTLRQYYLDRAETESEKERYWRQALQVTEAQLKIDPEHPGALLVQGATLISLGEHEKAISPLTRVLARFPRELPALLNRAVAYRKTGQFDNARRDLEAMRKLSPDLAVAHAGLGDLAYDQKQYQEALQHYEEYLRRAVPGTEEHARIQNRVAELKGR